MKHCVSAILAFVAIGLGSAQAGIVVFTNSGSIGEFSATNTGVVAGTATIMFNIPNVPAELNTVNGAFISPDEVTAVLGPVTMLVTKTGPETYSTSLVPATYQQSIGATPGAQAILDFGLSSAVTPLTLPNFLNSSGPIAGLSANSDPTYDFSQFTSGGGRINITLTATSFTGATDFVTFIATPGATAVGNGSFSEVVPEPASFGMLGIGLIGLICYRRWRR
jgi:hypothetical protein